MGPSTRARAPRGGFTLIEILAVLVILSILVGVLVTQLGGADEAARIQSTRHGLSLLSAAIEDYEREFGDFPPSSFPPDAGVSNDGTNAGAEALVAALWSRAWNAGGLLAEVEERLVNVDGDHAPRPLTDFDTRALLEIPDAWGNPVAYFHRQDYAISNRPYLTLDPASGEELTSFPAAAKNPVTGRYYRATRFQLISAGPDGRFGTEDDVTSFD